MTLAAATVFPVLSAAGQSEKSDGRPNILILMADEWRADAIGFMEKDDGN